MKVTITAFGLLLAFVTDVATAADAPPGARRPAATRNPAATARKAAPPPSGDGSTSQWPILKTDRAVASPTQTGGTDAKPASATSRTETVNNNESRQARPNAVGNPIGVGGTVTAGATASQPAQGTQGFTSAEGRSMSFELVVAPKPDAPPKTP
jgi:hypothetical protein